MSCFFPFCATSALSMEGYLLMPNRIANNGLRITKESVFSDRNLVHNYWVTCDSRRLKLTDTVCLFSCIWRKKNYKPPNSRVWNPSRPRCMDYLVMDALDLCERYINTELEEVIFFWIRTPSRKLSANRENWVLGEEQSLTMTQCLIVKALITT